jgi:DNA-directed RNA polymerase specialized sigma24 family protein
MPSNRKQERRGLKLLLRRPPEQAVQFDPEPETICYRGQTLAIVRHFFEVSCQLGRLPSILGREFFRAKVSHHTIPSFEDQALFAHDVESALMKLEDEDMEVITLVGLYDLSHEHAAAILRRSEGCVSQRYSEAIARLTQIFLDIGVLRRERPDRRQVQMKKRALPFSARNPKKPCSSVRQTATDQECAQERRTEASCSP